MKKTALLFIVIALCVCLFACGGREDVSDVSDVVSAVKKAEYYLGFAFLPKEAGEDVTLEATVAAVITDTDGKIINCTVDQLEAKADVDAITENIGVTFPTKNMLGDGYGMKGASGIGKEWDSQARAFADYCKGKTAGEIEKSLNGDGKIADLNASCTVNATDFVNAVKAAVKNTGKAFTAEGDIRIGLSINCVLSSASVESKDGEDGKIVYNCTMAATATDKNGKVYRAYIDEAEAEYAFDAEGNNTSEQGYTPKTKQELGNDYGMKTASGIGKEWFDQAEAFAEYCVGKTPDEINAALDGDGKIPDLKASCTVNSSGFAAEIKKAVENAL